MILINGAEADTITVHDRGLHYGDGLFETLAVVNGRPRDWARHMRRLAGGCARLGIPPPDFEQLQHEALRVCEGAERAVLKLIVTRGSGARGYRPSRHSEPARIVASYPWPEYPPSYAQEGVVVRVCSTRLACNPRLAGIKHLNRLEQVCARGEWEDPAIAEGLMLDTRGHVIEGTMSNLFIVRDGRLITPDVSECGVAGIMRERILETAREMGVPCEVTPVTPHDVKTAQEAFLCNSIITLWPVRELDSIRYLSNDLTQRIAARV